MNVVPAASPPAPAAAMTCPGCGAALAADQRYCLACGRPASPVRLAFLDVLQAESAATAGWRPANAPAVGLVASAGANSGTALPAVGAPYGAPPQDGGLLGWLHRYAGLMALLALLLMAGLIGLLVGHWASGSSGPQVVKIDYPNGVPAAAASAPATPSSAGTAGSSSASGKSAAAGGHESEAEEVKEVKEAETKKSLPPPVKTSPSAIQKLDNSTGKKHREEINKLANSTAPIETG